MNQKETDIALLELVRQGDKTAFKSLFDTYFTPLCRFMYLYVHDKTSVEEQALDIFIFIWENKETFKIHTSLKSYLYQSARNKCLNYLRRQKETLSLEQIENEIIDTDIMSLETDELYKLIEEAIDSLPFKCKQIFQLSRNEHLTNNEIAHHLNLSVKTVEGQITKALKKINKFLGDAYNYFW